MTRLLVATKMLLEALTKWSLGQKSETQVSDIYVRLGNDFNVANVAFGSYGIDMSDLASVPDDLRMCLERCLSEDPSPQTLEVHLPRIREIIIGLLQGLKGKQAEYKQYLVQSRASARYSKSRNERIGASEGAPHTLQSDSSESTPISEGMARASSVGGQKAPPLQSSEGIRRSILNQGGKRPVQAPPLDATKDGAFESITKGDERPSHSRQDSKSSEHTDDGSDAETASSTPVRRRQKSAASRLEDETDAGEDADTVATVARQEAEDSLTRHTLTDEGPTVDKAAEVSPALPASASYSTPSRREAGHAVTSSLSHSAPRPGNYMMDDAVGEMGDAADPSVRALKSRDALERRASKRFSAYTFNKMGVGLNQGMGMSSYALGGGGGSGSAMSSPMLDRREGAASKLGSNSRRGIARASSETPTSESARDYFSPSSRKAHKGHMLSSEDVLEEGKPSDSLPDTPSRRPNSTRRSSKASPGQSPRVGGTLKLAPPPLGSHTSQAMSSTESLPYVDASANGNLASPRAEGHEGREGVRSPPSSHLSGDDVPPVPPLPSAEERARLDAAQSNRTSSGPSRYLSTSPSNRTSSASMGAGASTLSTPLLSAASSSMTVMGRGHVNGGGNSMSIFLQLGRQTRKATIDVDHNAPVKGLSIGKLRMLFMDKFTYSPGKEDFPAIYLKDPSSGVTFELEDLSDVGEGTVLTLNIEPLEQVKQHLDLSLGTITRELRELKAAVYDRERDTTRRQSTTHFSTMNDSLAPPAPTLKISDAQFAMAGAKVAQYKRATMLFNQADATGQGPTKVATAATHESGWEGAGDQIKQQYDEVQKLRRHFAIISQIQGDFKADVGSLLSALREQAAKVRGIAASEVPTERNFIIAGKARLDTSSQEILTLVEDLLDLVDDLKADVIQRGVKPKPSTMKKLHDDITRATTGLEELSNYVETVKPSWKKTWELELQNIVDEQEFLNHQEGLISDLKEDHYSVQEVFQNIQEVVKLRGANKFTMTGGANGGGSDAFLGGVALKTYVPPPPEEGHEGLSTVMLEVKSQAVDHEKRLKALQAAERQRLNELLQRKGQEDEFQSELTTFVDGKALRKTGGYLETERVRTRRDKMTIQAMFSGGTNTVGGAPVEVKTPSAPPRKLSTPTQQPDPGSGAEAASSE